MPEGLDALEFALSLGAIAAQIAGAGFFAAAATALDRAARPRMHLLARQGGRHAKLVKHLLDRRENAIRTLQLASILASIGASIVASSVLTAFFGDHGLLYAAIVMTALVVVFVEVLPKTYAASHPDQTALKLARPTRVAVAILAPLVFAVRWVLRGALWLSGAPPLPKDAPAATIDEELRDAIEQHAGAEPEVRHERAMLRGVLDLDEVTVAQVMTHRRNVVTVDADDPPRQIVDRVLASGLQRMPVTRGQPDNIVGVLAAHTLMTEVMQRGRDLPGLDILSIAEKPWFIPESTTLFDQLQAFRQSDQRQALVVDEYGALMGVVSLSDILEEIVGDIGKPHAAEVDSPLAGVRPANDGSYVIEGLVTLRDLNRAFEWNLPDDAATTIAGLVLREARMIPQVGQVFAFHGFRFEILRRQRNQITAIRVTPPKPIAA
jgi:Mg2+/Co2+ transporter CorB